jgi:DMSO/TMAO reductase YedYZ molybdopterin-dependent catalytic subunit
MPLERTPLSRRELLMASAVSPLAAAGETAAQERADGPGLIIRQKEPENLEMRFAAAESWITPNEAFYVRSHFAVPKLDTETFRLSVSGAVQRQLNLSVADLKAMPATTLPATLECAGNSRVFLTPAMRGVQWELGAVSNAEWTGVPLWAVLEKAGVKPDAVDVVLEGADGGALRDDPKPGGTLKFARSLPVSAARRLDVLIAWAMNGRPLPVPHGAPLRVVVPGWYAMASIKWLSRIIVSSTPFQGFYQTVDYSYWTREEGNPVVRPITEMQVKSAIRRPQMLEAVPVNRDHTIKGAAWTSDADITRVEVSTDGGRSWSDAKLVGPSRRNCWRMWEHRWRPTETGRARLMSRATDSRGRTQPMERDPDRNNYMISHVLPVDVQVV